MPALFSRTMIWITASAFELTWRDVLSDARLDWTWQLPTDDLVVELAERHRWTAEQSVSYLVALQRIRRNRAGPATPSPPSS